MIIFFLFFQIDLGRKDKITLSFGRVCKKYMGRRKRLHCV